MRSKTFKLCRLTCFLLLIILSTSSAAAIKDFTLEAYFFQKVGIPFELLVKNALDDLGNPASGTVQIRIKAGDGYSPDSFPPILNPIVVTNGSGSAFQVLTNVAPTIFEGVVDTLKRISNTIFVTSGELHHFTLSVPSPQTSGQSFTSPSTLTAKDLYGNAVVNFDAAVDPVVISASDGGQMANHVFDHTQDFVLGVSDVDQKQTTYTGRGGFITFQALSQSGKTGTNLPVLVRSLRVESISVNPTSVSRGETVNIAVKVFNTADISGSVTDLDLSFSLGPLSYSLTNATFPKSISANSSFDFSFEAQIPQDYPSGISQVSATLSGLFNSFVIRDSSGPLASFAVTGALTFEYKKGSLYPKLFFAEYFNPDFTVEVIYDSPGFGLIDTTSTIFITDGAGIPIRGYLVQQKNIEPGADTILLQFWPKGYPFVQLVSRKYQLTLVLKGVEEGNAPFYDSLILSDSVELKKFRKLEYVSGSLDPGTVLAGTTQLFSFAVSNYTDSTVTIGSYQSFIMFSKRTDVRNYSFGDNLSCSQPNQKNCLIEVPPGIHRLYVDTIRVPEKYPWGKYGTRVQIGYALDENTVFAQSLKYVSDSLILLPPQLTQRLEVDVSSDGGVVPPDYPKQLMSFSLQNVDIGTGHGIVLNGLTVGFGGILAGELVSSYEAKVARKGWTITYPSVQGDKAVIQFPEPLILSPGQEDSLTFSATFKPQTETRGFTITLNQSDFQPRDYFEGQTGVPVPVTSSSGQPLNFVSPPYTIISGSFKGSASVYPNPFNPEKENATIIFASQPEPVNLQIFTLTGEKVGEAEIPANSSSFVWDGKNSDGKRVLSGVYLARLKVRNTGEEVKLRIGVVR